MGAAMNLEDFTPEQIERAKACKSAEELFALAKSEGVELTREQLDSLAGGYPAWEEESQIRCPSCGCTWWDQVKSGYYKCPCCGSVFECTVIDATG